MSYEALDTGRGLIGPLETISKKSLDARRSKARRGIMSRFIGAGTAVIGALSPRSIDRNAYKPGRSRFFY